MNYYKPKNFELYELIPQEYFEQWKDIQSKIWMCWDDRILYTLQRLRNRYGKIKMNDWYWNGNFHLKGWRPFNSKVGAELSQHKFFKAVDPSPLEYDVNKIRQDILNDPFNEDFKYISCIEMKVTWLHFDTRNWNKQKYGILKINP